MRQKKGNRKKHKNSDGLIQYFKVTWKILWKLETDRECCGLWDQRDLGSNSSLSYTDCVPWGSISLPIKWGGHYLVELFWIKTDWCEVLSTNLERVYSQYMAIISLLLKFRAGGRNRGGCGFTKVKIWNQNGDKDYWSCWIGPGGPDIRSPWCYISLCQGSLFWENRQKAALRQGRDVNEEDGDGTLGRERGHTANGGLWTRGNSKG